MVITFIAVVMVITLIFIVVVIVVMVMAFGHRERADVTVKTSDIQFSCNFIECLQ